MQTDTTIREILESRLADIESEILTTSYWKATEVIALDLRRVATLNELDALDHKVAAS